MRAHDIFTGIQGIRNGITLNINHTTSDNLSITFPIYHLTILGIIKLTLTLLLNCRTWHSINYLVR